MRFQAAQLARSFGVEMDNKVGKLLKSAEQKWLANLSDGELRDWRSQLTQELNACRSVYDRKKGQLRRAQLEIDNRDKNHNNDRLVVTDHAVVRYLERVKNFNVEAIRNEIRQIANRANKSESNSHIDPVTGLLLKRNDGSNSIATIIVEKPPEADI